MGVAWIITQLVERIRAFGFICNNCALSASYLVKAALLAVCWLLVTFCYKRKERGINMLTVCSMVVIAKKV